MPQPVAKDKLELRLHSPARNVEPVVYAWPLQVNHTVNEATEIVETIKWVCRDFPELWPAMQNHVFHDIDCSSYEKMKALCDKYNRSIDHVKRLWSGQMPPKCLGTRASPELVRHIFQQVYNHSVVDPEKLNLYEPFSPEVYGETSFELVNKIIEKVRIKSTDSFLDLGSGVGNVVLHVAAMVECKRIMGIEKAERPAAYAKEMEKQFRKWMAWYGKRFTPFTIIAGDFLLDEFQDTITSSSFIFANNFAFGPHVNHQLKERFAQLEEGTRLVSSREFCPINFRITKRNLSDIGTILSVIELESIQGAVSWTDKPVSYYLHTVDRKRLEKYFRAQKYGNSGGSADESDSEISRISLAPSMIETLAKDTNDTDGSIFTDGNSDNDALYGACTRQQWKMHLDAVKESRRLAKRPLITINGTAAGGRGVAAGDMPAAGGAGGLGVPIDLKKNGRKVRVIRLTTSESSSAASSPRPADSNTTAETAQHVQPVAQWTQQPSPGGTAAAVGTTGAGTGTTRARNRRHPIDSVRQRKKRERQQQKRRTDQLHRHVEQHKFQTRRQGGPSPTSPIRVLRSQKGDALLVHGRTPAINGIRPEAVVSESVVSALDDMLAEVRRQYMHYFQCGHQNTLLEAQSLLQQHRDHQTRLVLRTAELEEQVSGLKSKGYTLLQKRLDELRLSSPSQIQTQLEAAGLKHRELKARLASLEADLAQSATKTAVDETKPADVPASPSKELSANTADASAQTNGSAGDKSKDHTVSVDQTSDHGDAQPALADSAGKSPSEPARAASHEPTITTQVTDGANSPASAVAVSSSPQVTASVSNGVPSKPADGSSLAATPTAAAASSQTGTSTLSSVPSVDRAMMPLKKRVVWSASATATASTATAAVAGVSPCTTSSSHDQTAPSTAVSTIITSPTTCTVTGSVDVVSPVAAPAAVSSAPGLASSTVGLAPTDTTTPTTTTAASSPMALQLSSSDQLLSMSDQPLWKPSNKTTEVAHHTPTSAAPQIPPVSRAPQTPPASHAPPLSSLSSLPLSQQQQQQQPVVSEEDRRHTEIIQQVCLAQKVAVPPPWTPFVQFYLPEGHSTLAKMSNDQIQACFRTARRKHFELKVQLHEEEKRRNRGQGGLDYSSSSLPPLPAATACQKTSGVPPNAPPNPNLHHGSSDGRSARMNAQPFAPPSSATAIANLLAMQGGNPLVGSLLNTAIMNQVVLAAATSAAGIMGNAPGAGLTAASATTPLWSPSADALYQQNAISAPAVWPTGNMLQPGSSNVPQPTDAVHGQSQLERPGAAPAPSEALGFTNTGPTSGNSGVNVAAGGAGSHACEQTTMVDSVRSGRLDIQSLSVNEDLLKSVLQRVRGGSTSEQQSSTAQHSMHVDDEPSSLEHVTAACATRTGSPPRRKLSQEAVRELPSVKRSQSVADYIATLADSGASSSSLPRTSSHLDMNKPPPPPSGKPPRRPHRHSATSTRQGAGHSHHHHHDHRQRSSASARRPVDNAALNETPTSPTSPSPLQSFESTGLGPAVTRSGPLYAYEATARSPSPPAAAPASPPTVCMSIDKLLSPASPDDTDSSGSEVLEDSGVTCADSLLTSPVSLRKSLMNGGCSTLHSDESHPLDKDRSSHTSPPPPSPKQTSTPMTEELVSALSDSTPSPANAQGEGSTGTEKTSREQCATSFPHKQEPSVTSPDTASDSEVVTSDGERQQQLESLTSAETGGSVEATTPTAEECSASTHQKPAVEVNALCSASTPSPPPPSSSSSTLVPLLSKNSAMHVKPHSISAVMRPTFSAGFPVSHPTGLSPVSTSPEIPELVLEEPELPSSLPTTAQEAASENTILPTPVSPIRQQHQLDAKAIVERRYSSISAAEEQCEDDDNGECETDELAALPSDSRRASTGSNLADIAATPVRHAHSSRTSSLSDSALVSYALDDSDSDNVLVSSADDKSEGEDSAIAGNGEGEAECNYDNDKGDSVAGVKADISAPLEAPGMPASEKRTDGEGDKALGEVASGVTSDIGKSAANADSGDNTAIASTPLLRVSRFDKESRSTSTERRSPVSRRHSSDSSPRSAISDVGSRSGSDAGSQSTRAKSSDDSKSQSRNPPVLIEYRKSCLVNKPSSSSSGSSSSTHTPVQSGSTVVRRRIISTVDVPNMQTKRKRWEESSDREPLSKKPAVVSGALVVRSVNGSRAVVANQGQDKRCMSPGSAGAPEHPPPSKNARSISPPPAKRKSPPSHAMDKDSERKYSKGRRRVISSSPVRNSSGRSSTSSKTAFDADRGHVSERAPRRGRSYSRNSRSPTPPSRARSPILPPSVVSKRSRSPRSSSRRRRISPAERRVSALSPRRSSRHRDSNPLGRQRRSSGKEKAVAETSPTPRRRSNGDTSRESRKSPTSLELPGQKKADSKKRRSSRAHSKSDIDDSVSSKPAKPARPEGRNRHRRGSKWCERYASSEESDDDNDGGLESSPLSSSLVA